MMRCESSSLVSGPKFMVPSTSRETIRPVLPRWVRFMFRDITPGSRTARRAVGRCPTALVFLLGLVVSVVVRDGDRQSGHATILRLHDAVVGLGAHHLDRVGATGLVGAGALGTNLRRGVCGAALSC